jgi:hypothetical protein
MKSLIVVLALVLAGCAGSRELRLSGNPDVPAAQGVAKVSTTDNGNTKIDLVVKHLAPPQRVDPQAAVYMVWIRNSEANSQVQSLGALRVDDELEGTLTAVTPLRSFDLFVTAEPSQTSVTPTGKTLLDTSVLMK